MGLKNNIIEQLGEENPRIIITTDYLQNLGILKIKDIAYAGVFDWIVLDKKFKDIEYIEERDYGTKRYKTIKHDNIIEVNLVWRGYNLCGTDEIALLFITLYPSEAVNEVYFWDDNFDDYCKHEFDEDFLEESWQYVIDNDLYHTKFARAILKAGYKPPESETYSHWLSKLSHRQLKSARKN
jgi:hypothetical protein